MEEIVDKEGFILVQMSKKFRENSGPGGQGGNGKMPKRKFQDGVKLVSSSVKAVAAGNIYREHVYGE